ncbi:MAG TPA: Uma2 family endonuclease [Vicinamibacterales bacterium]|nr:Uma2 family endonuclease [Vicinamibacterales bacterium]
MAGGDDVRTNRAVKLTYEDFLQFPDDGKRHELIDGEHFVTPAPNTRHQETVGRLHLAIGNWLQTHKTGRVFLAPFDVVFSNFDIVEPDLLYMSNERAADILTSQHARGTPELVIEIGSPGTRKRDETIKRLLYERSGVAEYWVVDPVVDVVRVYKAVDGRFGRPMELSAGAGDVLTTSLLRGLEIPLAPLFAE